MTHAIESSSPNQEQWLKRYYFLRAGVSILWVAAAFAAGTKNETVAALLLLAYPAWDAIANWIDATRSGGLARNRTQRINVLASAIAALAVAFALKSGMHAVIAVIGAWAIAAGLLQLGTAVRRWTTHGAQWAMALSGAQSALAGGFFIAQSTGHVPPSIANVAGYAAVGAVYFLVSGIWLAVSHLRRARQVAV